MLNVKEIVLCAAIIFLGVLLGASIYESVVMAPNYRANIPESLEHARKFMSVTNPGNFFRIAAPLAQISLLVSLILNWKRPRGRRWWLITALILVVIADVITFTFHYPRNAILFTNPMSVAPQELQQAANEWAYGNYIRFSLVAMSLICSLIAFKTEKLEVRTEK